MKFLNGFQFLYNKNFHRVHMFRRTEKKVVCLVNVLCSIDVTAHTEA